jgi:hypothetical protein
MNFVTVRDESDLSTVVDESSPSQSQLTEWFVSNQRSSSGHALTYAEFPQMCYLGDWPKDLEASTAWLQTWQN